MVKNGRRRLWKKRERDSEREKRDVFRNVPVSTLYTGERVPTMKIFFGGVGLCTGRKCDLEFFTSFNAV